MEDDQKNIVKDKYIAPNDAGTTVNKDTVLMNSGGICNVSGLSSSLDGTECRAGTEIVRCCTSDSEVQNLPCCSLPASVRICLRKLPEAEMESNQHDLIAESDSAVEHCNLATYLGDMLTKAERKRRADSLLDCETEKKLMRIEPATEFVGERCKESTSAALEPTEAEKAIKNLFKRFGKKKIISVMKDKSELRRKPKRSTMEKLGNGKNKILKNQTKLLDGLAESGLEVTEEASEAEMGTCKKPVKARSLVKKRNTNDVDSLKKRPAKAKGVVLKRQTLGKAIVVKPEKARRIAKTNTLNAEKTLKRKPQGLVAEEANGVEKASKTKPENAEKLHKKSVLEANREVKKKPARTENVIKRSTNAESTHKVKSSQANKIVKKKPANAEIALKKRPAEAFTNKVEKPSRKRPEKAKNLVKLKVFKAQIEAKKRLTAANKEDLGKTAEDETGANKHPDKSEIVIKKKVSEVERTFRKKVLQAGNVQRKNKAEKEVGKEDSAETIRKTQVVRAKKVVEKKTAKTVKVGVRNKAIEAEKIDNKTSAKLKNVVKKKIIKTDKVPESKNKALKCEKVVEKKAAEGVMGKEGNTKGVVKKKATATVSESRKEETVRYTLISTKQAENKIGVKRKMTAEMSEILSTRTKKTNITFKRSLPDSLNKVKKTNVTVLKPEEMSEILSTRTKKTNIAFMRSLPDSLNKVHKTNVSVLRPKQCRTREFRLTAVKKTRVASAAEVGTLLKQSQQEQRETDVSFFGEDEAEKVVGENRKLMLHPVVDATRSEHRSVYSCSLQRDENSRSLQRDENSRSLQRDDSNENCLQIQNIDPIPMLCDATNVALKSSLFEVQYVSHHADELQVEVLDYTVLKQKKIDPDASGLVKESAETLTPEEPSFSKTRMHVEDHANNESMQRDNQGRRIIGSVNMLLPTNKTGDASTDFGESVGVENQAMIGGAGSVVPERNCWLNDSLIAAEGREIDVETIRESTTRLSDQDVCTRVQQKTEPCYESKPFVLNAEVQCVGEEHKPDIVMSNLVGHSSGAQQIKKDDVNDGGIVPEGGIAISAENPYTCLVTIEPLSQNAKNFGDSILSAGARGSFAVPQQAHQPKNSTQPQKHTRLDDIAGKLWKIKLEAVEHVDPSKKTVEMAGIQNQFTSSASELNTVVDTKFVLDSSVFSEHSYSCKQSTLDGATIPKQECCDMTQAPHFLPKPVRASNECIASDSVFHTTEQQLSVDAHSKRFTTLAADYLNSLVTPIDGLNGALPPSVAEGPAFEPAKAVVSFQNVTTIAEIQCDAAKHLQSFSGPSQKRLLPVTESQSSKLLSAEPSSAGIDSQNVTSTTEKLRVTLAKSVTTTLEDKLSDGVLSQNVVVKSEKRLDVVSCSENITDVQGKQLKAVTQSQNFTAASGKRLNAVSLPQSVAAMPEQLNTVAQSHSGTTMSEEESKVAAHSQSIAVMPAEQLKPETTPITHGVLVMPKEYLYGFTQPARLMLVPDQNYSTTEQKVCYNRDPNVGASASIVAYNVAQSQGATLTNPRDYYSSFLQHPGFPVVLQGNNCSCLQTEEVCCNAVQSQVRTSTGMLQLPCEICYAVVQSEDGNANLVQLQSNTREAMCRDVSQASQGDSGNLLPLHNDTCLPEHSCDKIYYFLEPSDNYKTDTVECDNVNHPQSDSDALLAEEVCYLVECDEDERKMGDDDNANQLQWENDVLLAEEVCCLDKSDDEEDGGGGEMAEDENAWDDVNGLRPQNDAFSSGEMCCFVESSEYETNEDISALPLQNDALLPEEVHCITSELNNLTDDGGMTQDKEGFVFGSSQNLIPEQSKKKLPRRQCKSLAAAKENPKDVEEKIQRRSTLGLRITPQRVTPFQFDHKGVTGKTDETPETSEDAGDVMSKLLQSLVKSNQKTTNPKKDLVEQQEPASKQRNKKPSSLLVSFQVGELVWARLSFQRFWPAIVVDPLSCGQSSTKPGYCWVFWFGDYKVSEVPLAKVLLFASNFSTKYVKSERKTYETGILEAIKELADRADGTDGGGVKSNKDLIAWASSLATSEVHNKWALRLPNWILEKLEKIRLAQLELQDSDTEPDVCRKDKSNANNAASEFGQGIQSITDICIVCHCVLSGLRRYQHPFFNGGLCPGCRETILQSIFFFDSDGTNSYCIICGFGKEVFVCEVVGCNKVYCTDCIARLAGEGIVEAIRKTNAWSCFLCATYDPKKHGLLEGKREWRSNLASLSRDSGIEIFPNKAVEDRQPIRVLSLFDGIGTGKLALDQLKIQIERYCASEVEQDAITVAQIRHRGLIRHLGDIRGINRHTLEGLGPIDLLIGGSPCNELSVANPSRRGLEAGSGLLFFDFVRILTILRDQNKDRPLFWIYENVASMNDESRSIISRMFECEPALWDAKYFSAQRRARYFWGNIPGMYCPLQYSASEAGGSLEDNLFPTRKAKVQKIRTITTQRNSLLMDRNKDDSFPVTMGDADDSLWIPEVERIFGFPEHYTDVANLSASRRLKLLGQSWSVPVIRHLLSPLSNFFQATSNAAETVSGAAIANNSEANAIRMPGSSATASSTANAAGYSN